MERLVELYRASGNKDEEAKWRKELDQVLGRSLGKLVGPERDIGEGIEIRGSLDAQTPALVYQVKLVAGKTYVFDMVSPDPKALDPFLTLNDSANKRLAEGREGAFNARITFRADRDGTFRIQATSFNAGPGAFTLTVREQSLQPKGEKN